MLASLKAQASEVRFDREVHCEELGVRKETSRKQGNALGHFSQDIEVPVRHQPANLEQNGERQVAFETPTCHFGNRIGMSRKQKLNSR